MQLTAPTAGTGLTINGRPYTVTGTPKVFARSRRVRADVVSERGGRYVVSIFAGRELEVSLDAYSNTGHRRGVFFQRYDHVPAGLEAVIA